MGEKLTLIDKLPELLVTPDREFSPRTPHTYAHTGATVLRRFHLLPSQLPEEVLGANVHRLYPDSPEATIYFFPPRGEGA